MPPPTTPKNASGGSRPPTLSIVTATHEVQRLATLAANIDSLREALPVAVEWVVAVDSEEPLPSLAAIVIRPRGDGARPWHATGRSSR